MTLTDSGFAGGDTRQHLGRELPLPAAHHHELGIEVGGAGIDVVGAEQCGVAVNHAALGMHAPTRLPAAEIGALPGQWLPAIGGEREAGIGQ